MRPQPLAAPGSHEDGGGQVQSHQQGADDHRSDVEQLPVDHSLGRRNAEGLPQHRPYRRCKPGGEPDEKHRTQGADTGSVPNQPVEGVVQQLPGPPVSRRRRHRCSEEPQYQPGVVARQGKQEPHEPQQQQCERHRGQQDIERNRAGQEKEVDPIRTHRRTGQDPTQRGSPGRQRASSVRAAGRP